MSKDLLEARQAILAVVEPMKLWCGGCYEVTERLGRQSGEDWLPDHIQVTAKAWVTAGEGFPCQEHLYNDWSFEGYGSTRVEAMQDLQRQVEAKVGFWQQLLDEDEELKTHVGERARALKVGCYLRLGESFDSFEAIRAARVSYVAGVEFDIVDHEPGYLHLRAVCGDLFRIARWEFYSYVTDAEGRKTNPNNYFEFLPRCTVI